ncbi:MAG: amidohydrolase family protein [Spirochaetales bacterium]|nr:amidohydrolase family protein [Spirochaetales bacterium]
MTQEQLLEDIQKIKIIDTHEHLPARESKRPQDTDVLHEYLIHYMNSDILSSGMPRGEMFRLFDPNLSVGDKWNIVEPWWENCRLTGYGRSLDLSVRELYDLPGIHKDTVEELDRKFKEARRKGGHYEYVLREKSGIALSVVDSDTDCDSSLFRSTVNMDSFIIPGSRAQLQHVEFSTGIRLRTFEDWLEACRKTLNKALDEGAVVLKSTLAYKRSLDYRQATRSAAETGFLDFFRDLHFPGWENPGILPTKEFQDYMMNFILSMAEEKGLPVQIHTGILEGNGNRLGNSDPLLLNDLFLRFPDLQFSIFHMGFPFQNVVSALVKNFPNVSVDMCWAHIISPSSSREALYQWLDTIPVNKIFGFGGDYGFIDGVCGHQQMARENIAAALGRLIKEGWLDGEAALHIACKILFDNPKRFLKLDLDL